MEGQNKGIQMGGSTRSKLCILGFTDVEA